MTRASRISGLVAIALATAISMFSTIASAQSPAAAPSPAANALRVHYVGMSSDQRIVPL